MLYPAMVYLTDSAGIRLKDTLALSEKISRKSLSRTEEAKNIIKYEKLIFGDSKREISFLILSVIDIGIRIS